MKNIDTDYRNSILLGKIRYLFYLKSTRKNKIFFNIKNSIFYFQISSHV